MSESQPRVALTFDDGPNEPWTSRLAAVLTARGVRGTFFQVGRAVRRDPESTCRLAAEGHVIGNHSWSHLWPKCWSARAMAAEIDRTQALCGELLGQAPTLYRPPWLLRTPGLGPLLERRGLRPVFGTFAHAGEPWQVPAGWTVRTALRRARPGAVLIFHDGFEGHGGPHRRSVDAVARTLDGLLERGWSCVTVPELAGP